MACALPRLREWRPKSAKEPSVVRAGSRTCSRLAGRIAPAYLHYGHRPRPATVMTVHNLAYQGKFPHQMLDTFGLPRESFTIHGVEYYGMISFLKAGLQFADRLTTVSRHMRSIQGDEGGMGLGGLLRERSQLLSGILNGIDTSVGTPKQIRGSPLVSARKSSSSVRQTKRPCSGGLALIYLLTRFCLAS